MQSSQVSAIGSHDVPVVEEAPGSATAAEHGSAAGREQGPASAAPREWAESEGSWTRTPGWE